MLDDVHSVKIWMQLSIDPDIHIVEGLKLDLTSTTGSAVPSLQFIVL